MEELSKAKLKNLRKEEMQQQRELEQARREQKQKRGRLRMYGLALLFFLAIVGFFYWQSMPPKDAPILDIALTPYNFGQVRQSKGTVSATIDLANTGTEPLVIKGMDTSCGCTSAAIVYNGVEGPRFSMAMHGTNPKNWKQVIPPGKTAQLKVYYDPNVHKSLRGPVTRSVYIFSNDPRNEKQEVLINAVQVD